MSAQQTVPLASVAHINPTLGTADFEADELVDFVPMAAVEADVSVTASQEVRPYDEVKKGYTYFADGDILLAKITPCFENGKISQIRTRSAAGFGSTEFHVIRPLPDRLDARYLVHLLRQEKIRIEGERRMTGSAGQRRVPKSFLESLPVFLPPLPEQRRIAAILDKADALRTKRREALAQLDRLAQSIFVEMFGDPATNPKGWDVVELQELVIDGDNINYGVIQPGDDLEEGVPLIRVGDMVSGTINHDALKRISPSIEADYKRSRLVGDELLLSCVGSIGAVALVTEKEQGFNIARAVARIRPRRDVSRDFLAIQLSLPSIQSYFRQELRTVSQPTLNIKQINETKVLRPPEGAQRAFSERISVFKRLHQSHCAANEALQDTFVALQHRAFRGEL